MHQTPFVQVLNTDKKHWVTASNVDCQQGDVIVNIYNSMLRLHISEDVKHNIASILFSSTSTLSLNHLDVDQQHNRYDCGLYSLACAYDICAGTDPCQVVYTRF